MTGLACLRSSNATAFASGRFQNPARSCNGTRLVGADIRADSFGESSLIRGELAGRAIGDYILMLAPTRWHLRRAVKVVNQTLQALGLEKHPDKTFIGKIARGFDFRGPLCGPKRELCTRYRSA